MPVEQQYRNSSSLYENNRLLVHASVGDEIHYSETYSKVLGDMDAVSNWLQEWYFGDRKWRYDGIKNGKYPMKTGIRSNCLLTIYSKYGSI